MRSLLAALALAALTITGALTVPAAASPPAPAVARTANGPLLPFPTSPAGDPPGANNWSCQATKKRPTPVILVHGTFGDRKNLLEGLSAAISEAGFCVYSLDYGNRGTGGIAKSARQLRTFTNRVLRSTGAEKVSMVGHSQGGMMPRYYIKFLGGKKKVDDLVGIAPSNHGTAVTGDSNPISDLALGLLCKACLQQSAGSPFLRRLNRGDETPGNVSYTQITTRYDQVVVPHTSGYLKRNGRGRIATNVTLQNVCPNELVEHIFIPTSSVTIQITMNALTRRGPAQRSFRPVC